MTEPNNSPHGSKEKNNPSKSKESKVVNDNNVNPSPPIVFVPALFGTELYQSQSPKKKQHNNANPTSPKESILIERGDEKVYVTVPIALNLHTPNLSLPLQWHHDDNETNHDNSDNDDDKPKAIPIQATDDISPGDPLESIKLCGCCTVVSQYTQLCQHFQQSSSKSNFHTFGYDWRRDLNETTNKLLTFLRNLKAANHNTPAQVLSHSMGCLITLAALHDDPSLFHSVLFAGGNFGGGAGFYPTNTEGMPVGLNKTFLGPDVVHTFPSMYAAASPVLDDPILRRVVKEEDGMTTTRQLFQFYDWKALEERGEMVCVPIDMWDVEHWKKYRLGPWSTSSSVSNQMEEHVRICLELGLHFQHRLRNTKSNHLQPLHNVRNASDHADGTMMQPYPPVAVLVGDQFHDPDYFLWDTQNYTWKPWTKQLLRKHPPKRTEKTDGTVSYISASNPPGLPKRNFTVREYKAWNNGPGPSGAGHRELMDEIELIEIILNDLCLDVNYGRQSVESTSNKEDCSGSRSDMLGKKQRSRRRNSLERVASSVIGPMIPHQPSMYG